MILLDVATSISAYPSIYGLDGFPMTIQSIVLEEELRLVGAARDLWGRCIAEAARLGGGSEFYTGTTSSFTRATQYASDDEQYDREQHRLGRQTGAEREAGHSGGERCPRKRSIRNPSLWTMQIPFTTPYTYTGGDLMTLVRHGGLREPVGTYVGSFFDFGFRYGTQIRTRAPIGNDPDATTTESDVPHPLALFSVDSARLCPRRTSTREAYEFERGVCAAARTPDPC